MTFKTYMLIKKIIAATLAFLTTVIIFGSGIGLLIEIISISTGSSLYGDIMGHFQSLVQKDFRLVDTPDGEFTIESRSFIFWRTHFLYGSYSSLDKGLKELKRVKQREKENWLGTYRAAFHKKKVYGTYLDSPLNKAIEGEDNAKV